MDNMTPAQPTKEIGEDHRYIIRVDQEGAVARWQVRFQTVGTFEKFYDDEYGGQDKSLAAAKKWRDEQMRLYPELAPGYKGRAQKEYGSPRSNNLIGVDGVTIRYQSDRGSICLEARWSDGDGKLRRKIFTVGRKYTLEEALYHAAKKRYEMTGRAREFENLELDFELVQKVYKNILETMAR